MNTSKWQLIPVLDKVFLFTDYKENLKVEFNVFSVWASSLEQVTLGSFI